MLWIPLHEIHLRPYVNYSIEPIWFVVKCFSHIIFAPLWDFTALEVPYWECRWFLEGGKGESNVIKDMCRSWNLKSKGSSTHIRDMSMKCKQCGAALTEIVSFGWNIKLSSACHANRHKRAWLCSKPAGEFTLVSWPFILYPILLGAWLLLSQWNLCFVRYPEKSKNKVVQMQKIWNDNRKWWKYLTD